MTNTQFDILFKKVLKESIDELQLFHGSQADFDKFDVAYMSSGWGQQAYGYGFYVAAQKDTAIQYGRGGIVYTVEIPSDGLYLSNKSISKREALGVARKFFKYYTTEDEYGKEAYAGHENEFWDEECRYVADCSDGESLYGTIASIIGSDRQTSKWLNKIGYTGIMLYYKSGDGKPLLNYVIFNPTDIKIISKERINNANTATEEIR